MHKDRLHFVLVFSQTQAARRSLKYMFCAHVVMNTDDLIHCQSKRLLPFRLKSVRERQHVLDMVDRPILLESIQEVEACKVCSHRILSAPQPSGDPKLVRKITDLFSRHLGDCLTTSSLRLASARKSGHGVFGFVLFFCSSAAVLSTNIGPAVCF